VSLYRDTGVVLRTYRLGEADRIIVLCTERHGKVRAVAKGVRKTKSKFGSRLEPTSHVALQLYEGRELDIVTQAETVDHFRSIRSDLERIAKASAMLEAVDQLAQEREPNPQLYQMLLGALRSLGAHDSPLVVPAFFLKLLALEGLRPLVEQCVECGAEQPLVAFDLDAGGALCDGCRRGQAISPDALALLQQVLGGRLGAALNQPVSSATHEVSHLATTALEHHIERRLRSVTLLDQA
jgi:DNA repair protein RecO (recombination protein O)